MGEKDNKPFKAGFRKNLYEVIFEAETKPGRLFDIILLWSIVFSVLAVLLESVAEIGQTYSFELRVAEWFFTIIFSIEYTLRVYCSRNSLRYIFSFYGIIDLLAVIPTYISFFYLGSQYLLVIRAVRLLRVFRILKMVRYIGESEVLIEALKASRPKITVFLGAVLTIVLIVGSLMHLIEGPENGFTSIPKSMYWAIVTLTTVGYGQITPNTPLGQFVAAFIMIMGYGIIAVPTGIVSVEISRASEKTKLPSSCKKCSQADHDPDAIYCKYCGSKITL